MKSIVVLVVSNCPSQPKSAADTYKLVIPSGQNFKSKYTLCAAFLKMFGHFQIVAVLMRLRGIIKDLAKQEAGTD